MNIRRQEAIDVIKEIEYNCKLLNPRAINLEPAESHGQYEIHVKSSVSDEDWQCLKTIAKKNGLGDQTYQSNPYSLQTDRQEKRQNN
jgi:hypothetical protein